MNQQIVPSQSVSVSGDCSSRHMFAPLTVMTRLRAYSGQVVFTLIDLAPGPLRALLCPAIHQHSYTSSNAIKTFFCKLWLSFITNLTLSFSAEDTTTSWLWWRSTRAALKSVPNFFFKWWMLIPRVLSAPQYFLQMWLVIQWYRERIPWLKFRSGVCSNIVCSIIQSVMANLNLLKSFLQSRYHWNIFVTYEKKGIKQTVIKKYCK